MRTHLQTGGNELSGRSLGSVKPDLDSDSSSMRYRFRAGAASVRETPLETPVASVDLARGICRARSDLMTNANPQKNIEISAPGPSSEDQIIHAALRATANNLARSGDRQRNRRDAADISDAAARVIRSVAGNLADAGHQRRKLDVLLPPASSTVATGMPRQTTMLPKPELAPPASGRRLASS